MAEQDIPPPTITAMKIPIIRKGEYDIWSMRMRQYICHTDHNLWDVIVNGDLEEEPAPTGETSAPPAPKTAKQLAAKRNQERVKSILLLAIPDEYLLKFHNVADAKSLWEAIKSRFGGNEESKKMQKNVLKHQFEKFSTASMKIDEDDLEELDLRWQCYNYHRKAHFARECRSGRNQGKRSYGDTGRSNAPTNESSSQALVAQDGTMSLCWIMILKEPINYAYNGNLIFIKAHQLSFTMRSSDEENTLANDSLSKVDGFHTVPPPITGNFLTSRADISFVDAKSLWEAIKSGWSFHGATNIKEDINQKFLRSLPPSWNQIALIIRNNPDIDEIDIDDLYNNLRCYNCHKKGALLLGIAELEESREKDHMVETGSSNAPTNDLQYQVTGVMILKCDSILPSLIIYCGMITPIRPSKTTDPASSHLLSFHDAEDQHNFMLAIKARFGGNEASKKMQKNLLKQQFETFTIGSREELDSAYERFQHILSMLELYDAKVSQEDAHTREFLLKKLPIVCMLIATMIRGQPGLDELEFDDLYNNLKVYEHELKKLGHLNGCADLLNIRKTVANWSSRKDDVAIEDPNQKKPCTADDTPVSLALMATNSEDIQMSLALEVILKTQKRMNMHGDRFGVEYSSSEENNNSSGDETLIDPLYENFKREKAYKAVPPPTGTIIPPRANVSFTGIDELAIRNKVVNQEKTKTSQPEIDRNKFIIEDWFDSDDEETIYIFRNQKKTYLTSEIAKHLLKTSHPNSQNMYVQGIKDKETEPKGSTVGSQAVLLQKGNPEEDLKDYAIIDSGCSGSMTGDKDKLSDFKEFKGGYDFSLENQENQKGKGPDWMFDLELLNPSMNYIPVRKENYADSGEKVSTLDDVEDLDDQQFIVHGPSIHAAQPMHSEERTADKEVSLSSKEQALHDELVNLMHQESLAKLHHDAQRTAFKEEKKRIALAKEKGYLMYQQFIVHGPSNHALSQLHTEERTADKETPLKNKRREDALAKEKDVATVLSHLSTTKTPPKSTEAFFDMTMPGTTMIEDQLQEDVSILEED
ncbi:hypothetical protein Tco_0009330 [Tanacetum coccineum]